MKPGFERVRRKSAHLKKVSALLVVYAATVYISWAQTPSACTPPESMKERLAGKPDAATLNDLGAWLGEHDDYACAAEAFATSLQMEPRQKDMPHVAFMFGASLFYSGNAKDAVAALQEAEQFGYNEIKLHLVLARALETTNAMHDAEAEWRAALDDDPEYSYALDSLSDDLLADHDNRGVIEALDKPRLVPQRTVHQALNLGTAYQVEGKHEDAERVLRDALNTYPDAMELATKLSEVLTQSGKKAEAEAVMRIVKERQTGSTATKSH